MKCPRCHNQAVGVLRALLSWPSELVPIRCRSCDVELFRRPISTVRDGFSVWLTVALAFAPFAIAPGIYTFALSAAAGWAVYRIKPWQGVRYEIADGEKPGVRAAQVVSEEGKLGREPDAHGDGPQNDEDREDGVSSARSDRPAR